MHIYSSCRILSVFIFIYCRPEDWSHRCLHCLHRAKPAAAIAATVLLPHACRSSDPRCPPGSPPCSTRWRSAILSSQYSSVIRTSSPLAQELRELSGEFIHGCRILLSGCIEDVFQIICCLYWHSLGIL